LFEGEIIIICPLCKEEQWKRLPSNPASAKREIERYNLAQKYEKSKFDILSIVFVIILGIYFCLGFVVGKILFPSWNVHPIFQSGSIKKIFFANWCISAFTYPLLVGAPWLPITRVKGPGQRGRGLLTMISKSQYLDYIIYFVGFIIMLIAGKMSLEPSQYKNVESLIKHGYKFNLMARIEIAMTAYYIEITCLFIFYCAAHALGMYNYDMEYKIRLNEYSKANRIYFD
jgi:hypothetical protein